jgi:hypothetical protein
MSPDPAKLFNAIVILGATLVAGCGSSSGSSSNNGSGNPGATGNNGAPQFIVDKDAGQSDAGWTGW